MMPRYLTSATLTATLAAAILATPITAQAKPHGCPPGLAKKDVACVPPGHILFGQVKNATKDQSDDSPTVIIYAPGDRMSGDYIRLDDPARYGLDPSRSYYRVGDQVYQVDRHTKEVLNVIGAIAALAN